MSVSMRCDSHVHVIGPIARYPQLPDRTYLAGPAPLEDLRRAAETRSISRFVIVQPSFYGTDNTLLLEALDTLRANGKGVAVIDPASARSDMLASYAARGVCGLRINLYSLLGKLEARLDRAFAALEAIAHDMGWHVEVIAPIQILAEHSALLAKARVPVVIDHYGVYGAREPQSAEGGRLLELLSYPHVWIRWRHGRTRRGLRQCLRSRRSAASGEAIGRIPRRMKIIGARRLQGFIAHYPTSGWSMISRRHWARGS
jgi:predicted TIM-barrel fold metal-dependent hydrolase